MADSSQGVVTRFAPSPTGYLHIGGARTALFNWLFARHHGGKALLRIEDTDAKRSTQQAIDAIVSGLNWLGLSYDEPPVFQSQRADRHREVALKLLDAGHAYRCFATPGELEQMRAQQRASRQPLRYDRRWRDRSAAGISAGTPFTVRLKAPEDGETVILDAVQGEVWVQNKELDDYVLLRADGTPTYMLAVVVDDHDMGVTHIIRGDDHLNNAFRQLPIFRAMDLIEGGWPDPTFAHIPLIHGSDGAKLSKRHGALGVEAYRDEFGILPEALFNYLLRLGWSSGDREEITCDEAIELFSLSGVGRSPSRFDAKKLESLNGHYLRQAEDERLAELVVDSMQVAVDQSLLARAMPVLKARASNLNELIDGAAFLSTTQLPTLSEKARSVLDESGLKYLKDVGHRLRAQSEWTSSALEIAVKSVAEEHEVSLGKLAQPLRAALTGSTTSPGIFDVLELLGREVSLARIDVQLTQGGVAEAI